MVTRGYVTSELDKVVVALADLITHQFDGHPFAGRQGSGEAAEFEARYLMSSMEGSRRLPAHRRPQPDRRQRPRAARPVDRLLEPGDFAESVGVARRPTVLFWIACWRARSGQNLKTSTSSVVLHCIGRFKYAAHDPARNTPGQNEK